MNPDDPVEATSHHEKSTPGAGAYSKNTRDLLRIATVSTSIAFAFMAASVEALRNGDSGFFFHVSSRTIIAFMIGALIPLLVCWALVAKTAAAVRRRSFLWVLAGAAAFFYPLRFLPGEKLPEIAQGLFLAACAISFGVYLLWRLNRFFDRDTERNDSREMR